MSYTKEQRIAKQVSLNETAAELLIQTPSETLSVQIEQPIKSELPIRTAISLHREKDGWVAVVYEIQGNVATVVHTTPPNLKIIAMDEFRILAGGHILCKDN
jgi:hypothetical protein